MSINSRELYERKRGEKFFGTRSPYIYSLKPMPSLVCDVDGTMLYHVNTLQSVLKKHSSNTSRYEDGVEKVIVNYTTYNLEWYAIMFGQKFNNRGYDMLCKLSAYMNRGIDPECYMKCAARELKQRTMPIYMNEYMRTNFVINKSRGL